MCVRGKLKIFFHLACNKWEEREDGNKLTKTLKFIVWTMNCINSCECSGTHVNGTLSAEHLPHLDLITGVCINSKVLPYSWEKKLVIFFVCLVFVFHISTRPKM